MFTPLEKSLKAWATEIQEQLEQVEPAAKRYNQEQVSEQKKEAEPIAPFSPVETAHQHMIGKLRAHLHMDPRTQRAVLDRLTGRAMHVQEQKERFTQYLQDKRAKERAVEQLQQVLSRVLKV